MTPEFAAAFVAAQAELQAVVKDSLNPHFRNRYASLDRVIETIRPVLAKYKLGVTQSADPSEDARSLFVRSTLVHVSGETLSNSCFVPLSKLDPQGAGGALTYGRRYGLSALLCLATDEDDDA